MTWADVGEITKVLGAVATSVAAWFAATIAYRGLEKWRSEALGKRRAEVAESVLASVYELEEIFRSARSRWVLPHETSKQHGLPDEIAQNIYYTPERRLSEHEEFFGRFRTLKHQFAALFGREAAKPFDELWRIRIDINHAVECMMRNKDMSKSREPRDRDLWQEWHGIAFKDSVEESDELAKRITAQVSAIESTCKPAIEAREK